MAIFDCNKGLFHFVFANENDCYYDNSFIRLNLHSYLYCELQKRKYENIYFFEGDKSRYNIFGVTQSANELYTKYEQKENKSKFKFWGNKQDTDKFKVVLNTITQMLEKENHLAFVISIDTFNEISNYPDIIEILSAISNKNSKNNYTHIILIQAPVITDDTRLNYFSDKDKIFRSKLFPDIQRIFNKSKNIYIYDELKNELDDRVICCNRLDYDSIYSMLANTMLKKDFSYIKNSIFKIDDFAEFIYAFYNSKQFRNDMEGVLPKNTKRLLIDIEKALENKNTLLKIEEKIQKLRSNYDNSQTLKSCILLSGYTFDMNNMFISYANNPNIAKIERIYNTFSYKTTNSERVQKVKYQLLNIMEQLNKPYINLVGYECPFDRYLDFATNACNREGKIDIFTIEKAINAIKYSINRLFSITIYENENNALDYEGNSKNIKDYYFDIHISILKVSWELFNIENKYYTLLNEIANLKNELKTALEEEKKFALTHSSAVENIKNVYQSSQISNSAFELTNKRSRVNDLQKTINNNENTKIIIEQYRDTLRKNINDMEIMIESSFAENASTIEKNMSEFVQNAKQKIKDNDNILRDIQNRKIEIDAVIDYGNQMQYDRIIDNAIYDTVRKNEQVDYNIEKSQNNNENSEYIKENDIAENEVYFNG